MLYALFFALDAILLATGNNRRKVTLTGDVHFHTQDEFLLEAWSGLMLAAFRRHTGKKLNPADAEGEEFGMSLCTQKTILHAAETT